MTIRDNEEIITVRDLERVYKGLILEDFLRTLSYEDLINCETLLYADDILGIRVAILDAIKNEKRKRLLEKYLVFRNDDADVFVVKNVVERMSMEEIELSDDYLRNNGIEGSRVFKGCPLFLSIDKMSKLFGFYREIGYDDESIISLLTDENKCEFAQHILMDSELSQKKSMLKEHSFKEFIKNVANKVMINNQK